MLTRRFLLLLALALPLAACETTHFIIRNPDNQTPDADEWQSTEPLEVPSFEVLWERSRATLELEGYALDPERTRFDEKTLVSRWITHLAPARLEGIRRRAHVEFEPQGDRWFVRVCILRQRNADIDSPSNPSEAQWESHGTDVSRGALLLWKIRAGFAE